MFAGPVVVRSELRSLDEPAVVTKCKESFRIRKVVVLAVDFARPRFACGIYLIYDILACVCIPKKQRRTRNAEAKHITVLCEEPLEERAFADTARPRNDERPTEGGHSRPFVKTTEKNGTNDGRKVLRWKPVKCPSHERDLSAPPADRRPRVLASRTRNWLSNFRTQVPTTRCMHLIQESFR